MEKVNPRTHCNHCRAELTKDEKRGCMVCRVCHPEGGDKPLVPQIKPKLLDVKFTEEQIREIVRDELENWHIQKPAVTKEEMKKVLSKPVFEEPPVTKDEVEKLTDKERLSKEIEKSFMAKTAHILPDWRAQAKELGIPLFQRKKADVLAEIAKKKAS